MKICVAFLMPNLGVETYSTLFPSNAMCLESHDMTASLCYDTLKKVPVFKMFYL